MSVVLEWAATRPRLLDRFADANRTHRSTSSSASAMATSSTSCRWKRGRCLPLLHRLAAVLRRRGLVRRSTRQADELGKVRRASGARPGGRRPVLRPVDWGFTSISTTPMSPGGHQLGRAVQRGLRGPHLHGDDGPAAGPSRLHQRLGQTTVTDEQSPRSSPTGSPRSPEPAHTGTPSTRTFAPSLSGDIWVAYAWRCYARRLRGTPVAYANPEEGRNSWVCMYGISSSSEPRLALGSDASRDTTCGNAVTLFYYGCVNSRSWPPSRPPSSSRHSPSMTRTSRADDFTHGDGEQRLAWGSIWTR